VTLHTVHRNFAAAGAVLDRLGVGRADAVLADLGFASPQVDDPKRGLSFSKEGPLDMRLDPTGPTTAADLVARLDERELASLLWRYGEERASRRIAAEIVAQRQVEPILTTGQLTRLVRSVLGGGAGRIDPATRTFMALRIAVNGELEALDALLDQLPALLKPGGRAALISFHSLEDRAVKRAFAELHRRGLAEPLTRKPWVADEAQVASNPRSRSAKLRGLVRLGDGSPGTRPE
jgi:16S rRNA (cytosine1402-N4)-methyltransferase